MEGDQQQQQREPCRSVWMDGMIWQVPPKRSGIRAEYMEPWHSDITEFLEERRDKQSREHVVDLRLDLADADPNQERWNRGTRTTPEQMPATDGVESETKSAKEKK